MFRVIFAFCGVAMLIGCAATRPDYVARAQNASADFPFSLPEPTETKNGDAKEKNGDNKDDEPKTYKCKRPPKTLFEWAIGHDCQCEVEDDEEDDEEEEEEPDLASDRPDFTESSTNVGAGRVQIEMGYTFTHDREFGTTTRSHSYPETLVRIGLWADWLEFRIGQNFASEQLATGTLSEGAHGAEDLYLGIGLALTEQKGCLPESKIILQTLVPTGSGDHSDDQMLPGINFLYGWDIVPDHLTCGGSTQANRSRGDNAEYYVEVAQSFTVGYSLTDKLSAYTEWFGLFPCGSTSIFPQHYFDAGFTYLVTKDFQLDIRAGVGLNRHADDLFTGAGFVRRF